MLSHWNYIGVLCASAFLFSLLASTVGSTFAEELDQCELCHTVPARLVPAVREAEKARQALKRDLSGVTVEAEGEG